MPDHQEHIGPRRDREKDVCYKNRVLESLTIDDFKPHVGSSFRVTEPAVELRLERVAAVMESERARLKRQAFSLYFRGPAEPLMPQRIYRLNHKSFSEPLEIFLVPVGRTSEGVEYEAVFT
jgi:hypothetical protein